MFFRVRPRVRIEPGLIRIYRGALFEGSSAGRDNKKVCTVYRVDYKKYKLRLNKLEVPLFGTLKYLRSMGQRTRLSTARPRFQPIRAHQAFGRNLDKAFPVPLLRCQGTLNTSYTSWYWLVTLRLQWRQHSRRSRPRYWRETPALRGRTGGDVDDEG